MLKPCTVVSLFIYALLNSVSYTASLLSIASTMVQNSVSLHETKSLYFGAFSISNPTKSVFVCIFSKSVYKGLYYINLTF